MLQPSATKTIQLVCILRFVYTPPNNTRTRGRGAHIGAFQPLGMSHLGPGVGPTRSRRLLPCGFYSDVAASSNVIKRPDEPRRSSPSHCFNLDLDRSSDSQTSSTVIKQQEKPKFQFQSLGIDARERKI